MKRPTILGIAILFVTLLGLAGCAAFKHANEKGSAYQQCRGLQREMLFIRTSEGGNNLDSFQRHQALIPMRGQYNKLNCDEVLAKGKNGGSEKEASDAK